MTDHDQNIAAVEPVAAMAGARIIDAEGRVAHVTSIRQDGAVSKALIRIDQGPEVWVPLDILLPQTDGSHVLPLAFRSVPGENGNGQIVMPIWHEELQVGKRTVDTGKGVRIRKTVSSREQRVDEPLLQDELVVERVAIGRRIDRDNPPTARHEGATLVVPVLEERLVVEKQLWLQEEVRVTTTRHAIHRPQTVTLRAEQATVEQFDEDSSTSPMRSTSHDPHINTQD